MDAFRQAALQQFEDKMVEHLKECAPSHWKAIGEADGRKVIRMGIERAKEYGITSEQGVCLFIDLSFFWGNGFDQHLQWAAETLRDSRIKTESEKLSRLRIEAVLHENDTAMPHGETGA